tara:strand:+ start:534 stop:836 length:303 start_codon:yes stop_codon:yes gene_type:complete
MKNIQIIDGANNCEYAIYSIEEKCFNIIFPNDTDVQFIEDIYSEDLKMIFEKLWGNQIRKKDVVGIHGTLFYGLISKKKYYPNLMESDLRNKDVINSLFE